MLKILQARLQQDVNRELPDVQAGFRKGRGSIDQIANIRWIIKKFTNNKFWRGCGEKGMLLHFGWECKLIQPLWKTVWRFLKKQGIDPAIPRLGVNPEKTKIEKNTCIQLFIAALFTIARTWKQPRCPSTDE